MTRQTSPDLLAAARSWTQDGAAVDATLLGALLDRPVAAARLRPPEPDEKQGGLSGDFFVLDVEFSDDDASTTSKDSLVLKVTGRGKEAHAATLGTAREAKFFATLGRDPALEGVVPRAVLAEADLATGAKAVLMEKIEHAAPLGIFFGRGNPNNWGFSTETELATVVAANGGLSATDATAKAFALYAKLHARFWRDVDAVRADDAAAWLRGARWFLGSSSEEEEEEEECSSESGRAEWEAAQALAADAWAELRARKDDDDDLWADAHLVACLEAAYAKVDFDAFRRAARHTPWAVVHGDCHPHNVLRRRDSGDVVLIDFEMVGLGSPAQDLGQFVISHLAVEDRRRAERDLVHAYYDDLVCELRKRRHPDAATYTFDACWAEYVAGGAGRWLWFVPYLAKHCPPDMARFFNHQLAAFLRDHVPDPADAPMPRV